MNQPEPPKKKMGMTSTEFAALMLSGGHTDNLNKAAAYAKGVDLNMDALQRSHLRRMMGFDFEIQQMPNIILVTSKQKPFARTRCDILEGETDSYGNVISEALIDRLVDACMRLKNKWLEIKRREATR